MNKNRVVRCFERFRFTYSDAEEREVFSDRGDSDNTSLPSLVQKIQSHQCQYPQFYRDYDYEWALDPSSYSCPLEAYLQLKILRILAEAKKFEDIRERYKAIVIRILPSASTSTYCVDIEEFRFIVMPSGYTILTREFLYYMFGLIAIGQSNRPDGITFGVPSELGGSFAALALVNSFSESMPYVLRLFSVARDLVNHCQPIIENEFTSGQLFALEPAGRLRSFAKNSIHWMEMFVICHELVHILQHPYGERKRLVQLEKDADTYALSLLIIHGSMSVRYEQQAEPRLGYIYGPILAILLERLVAEVRWTVSESLAAPTAVAGGRSGLEEMANRFTEFSEAFKFIERQDRRADPLRKFAETLETSKLLTHCFYDAQAFHAGFLARFHISDFMEDPSQLHNDGFAKAFSSLYGTGLDWFQKTEEFLLNEQVVANNQLILMSPIPNIIARFGCGKSKDTSTLKAMIHLWRRG